MPDASTPLFVNAGGGVEVFNDVIANASDGTGKLYATNRVGGSFSYSFSAADGLEVRPLPTPSTPTSLFAKIPSWQNVHACVGDSLQNWGPPPRRL